MREIKFRAWETARSRMSESFRIQDMVAEEYDGDAYINGCCIRGLNDNWEDYILMQYTGLKDKNGKECYWDDWATDGINPAFLVTPDYHLLARLSEIEFEILGNKHENPELLEADND